MRIVSHPEADEELQAAARWYEQKHPGLGEEFLVEFERTVLRLAAEPFRWRRVKGNNRKISFHRFPYAIIYLAAEDQVHITAVMHLHRRPFYWSQRRGRLR